MKMAKMTVELSTDENGYFSKTISYNPPGPFGVSVHLSATLLSPSATSVWGNLDIDAKDGKPSNQQRAFVIWHSEEVQLGSWRLDGGDNIVVVNGKTMPRRAHSRLLLEIEASL